MAKLAVFLLLVLIAMLAAGLFGALHNQLSYTVGPDYFHAFKFPQFRIPEETPARIGAALVGWRASWWMGLIIGLPVFLLGLFLCTTPAALWRNGLRALGLSIFVTTLFLLTALIFGKFAISPEIAAQAILPNAVIDPVGFLQAGVLHDASYIGGFVSIFAAVWLMFRAGKQQ